MSKKSKILLFVFLYILLGSLYFVYAFKIYIPKKSTETSNFFINNESSRHILKVSILSEKGYRFYRNSLEDKNENNLYDGIDYTAAAAGFLTSFSFDNINDVSLLLDLINENIDLMEKYELNINKDDLNLIRSNVDRISKVVQTIEIKKYNSLLEGIISREENTYMIIISIIYLSVSIVFLITFLLFILYRNKKLEEENLKQQKIFLLQSKQAALGEMLGNIAHQWRQPLSVITTSVSGLKLYLDLNMDVKKDDIHKCVDDVMAQANYLSSTINDFSNFINEDKKNIKSVNILNTIITLETLVKDIFSSSSIKIIKSIKKDININKYDNILIQAIINILHNSKDAFEKNLIKNSNRYFFIIVEKIDSKLIIKLKDSAGGINPLIINKIFEVYFTTKHKARGTGLGLFRSYEIITKYLNADIKVQNVEYKYDDKDLKGVEFIITLDIN
ncbi:MAG: HAMP domain-containing histidine kinase [Campylobacteraceae bacterium]|nr:HAMP domain-containing histidine kinase [Campylobacteraceae bacterium]